MPHAQIVIANYDILLFQRSTERRHWSDNPDRGGEAHSLVRGLPGAAVVDAVKAGGESAQEDQEKNKEQGVYKSGIILHNNNCDFL